MATNSNDRVARLRAAGLQDNASEADLVAAERARGINNPAYSNQPVSNPPYPNQPIDPRNPNQLGSPNQPGYVPGQSGYANPSYANQPSHNQPGNPGYTTTGTPGYPNQQGNPSYSNQPGYQNVPGQNAPGYTNQPGYPNRSINQGNLVDRARVVGLADNSSEADIKLAESRFPNAHPNVGTLDSRANVVGLPNGSSEEAIQAEELKQFPKGTLSSRAIAAGLDYNSSLNQIETAEATLGITSSYSTNQDEKTLSSFQQDDLKSKKKLK